MKFTYPSGSRPLDGYTIKRGVGKGGFGEVYYATSDAGKEVALKLVRRNLDVEVRGVTQCLNLKHQNLIGLYDIKHDEHGDAWVIMEYVRGESLEDMIQRYPHGAPLDEVLSWMYGICDGVAYLHDGGIVHRDLKPGNIFSDDGVVKIGDYGLSKFISASRRSGQTESVGTVHYMAPEIANGRYGKEIDIYALGIILYESLTGHVPFEGESVGEVLMKHLTAEPDLTQLREPFRSVVARALSKDPEQRFHSVRELKAALPLSGSAAAASTATLPPPHPRRSTVDQQAAGQPAPGNGARPAGAERAGATAPVVPAANVISAEEPVMRGLRNWAARVRAGFDSAGFPPAVKVVLAITFAIALVMTAPFWLLPVAGIAVVYLVYFVIWATFMAPAPAKATTPPPVPQDRGPPREPVAAPQPARNVAPPAPQPPRRSQQVYRPAQFTMPVKGRRQGVMELCGSMLLSALIVVALCVVITALSSGGRFSPQSVDQFAWLALVGIAGAWAILVPAKFWEGTEGEPILRRFVLLCAGLGLGLFGYGMDQLLLVDLPTTVTVGAESLSQGGSFDAAGNPTLVGYLAYFGFLFPILRWWRQANPLRWTRFSLWATAICVFWAALLNLAWPFPQPWGMMIAAMVSVSVQLSSPWVDQERLARRLQG